MTSQEAFDLIRSLIDHVRLIPNGCELVVELHGDLAGILAISEGAHSMSQGAKDRALQIKMVAGG